MHVDNELKSDKDFALSALKVNPQVFNFLDKNLKADQDILDASK